jgi:hypothetical protein
VVQLEFKYWSYYAKTYSQYWNYTIIIFTIPWYIIATLRIMHYTNVLLFYCIGSVVKLGVTELVHIWPNLFPFEKGILLGITLLVPVCVQVK